MSDPLDSVLLAVDPLKLSSWQDGAAADQSADAESGVGIQGAPFPIDASINSKLVLWDGDFAALKATAIVNVSNENLNDRNPLSVRILDLGGPALQREVIETVKSCRTGEAKVTKGYRLPARFIIHTVGPRYNAKYRTAAESALYNSTRAVLEQVLDRGVDCLGLAPIHSIKRGYPPEEGAHLTLRCLRRFLERHGAGISRLLVATSGPNGASYPELAALYFPRTLTELRQSQVALGGANLGGPMGEPVHQGRGIRIAANPLGEQRDSSSDESSPPPSPSDGNGEGVNAAPTTAVAAAAYFASASSQSAVSGVGSHAFARMEQNPDTDASRRQKRGGGGGGGAGGSGSNAGARQSADVIRADQLLASERRYDRWLRRARQQDLSRLRASRCLFHSGHDVHGRPVVVVIGSKIPPQAERNYEDLALLVLSVLEPLIGQPYVLLYAHCGYDALPHSTFLKELRDLLTGEPRWSSNLACLIHVHADRRTRLFWWWFAKFTATGIRQQFADCLQDVFHLVGPDQLDLPDSVYELDRRVAKETKSPEVGAKPPLAEPKSSAVDENL